MTNPGGRRARHVQRSLHGLIGREFRPDVEGLRAIAVVVVVAFHLRIDAFSGGFVGVDIFFVLSGFLITRLLLGELAQNGSIDLTQFWARRARRLLPASIIVLVATVVASRLILDPLAVRNVTTDAMAAGAFAVNFVFADRLGDYFAAQLAEAAPSPLLHFWSLAVEEQFYLLLPLGLVALTRRPRQFRRLLTVVISVGVVGGAIVAWWMTRRHPTGAYYLLPARAGELLVGAAVATAGASIRNVSATFRAWLAWLGIFGIVVAVVGFDSSTEFPGTAVWLPVLSTALVLCAGGEGGMVWGPQLILDHRVGRWIGRHSYAIYLWHWPVLVLGEAAFDGLALPGRFVLAAASVGLAAVSLRWIEDPVRHDRRLAVSPRLALGVGGSLCAVALVVAFAARATIPSLSTGTTAAAPVLEVTTAASSTQPAAVPFDDTAVPPTAPPTTIDAAVAFANTSGGLDAMVAANQRVLASGLAIDVVPENLRPSLQQANADRAPVYDDGCVLIGVETELRPCTYGVDDAAVTVVLYGDSHAAHWTPALIEIADQRGFELIVLTKGGCPTAAVAIPTATLGRTCPQWRDSVVEFLQVERPDVVIVSAWGGYPNDDDEWASGLDDTLGRVAATTNNLIVLGDNPPADVEPAGCLSANLHSVQDCSADRDEVVRTSRNEVERDVVRRQGGRYIDTADWLCGPERCPLIIGDVLLYRDATHLTTAAAEWFTPLLAAALAPTV